MSVCATNHLLIGPVVHVLREQNSSSQVGGKLLHPTIQPFTTQFLNTTSVQVHGVRCFVEVDER